MCVQQYNNSSSTVVVQQKKTKAKKQGQQGCPGIGMDIKNGQNGNVNGALWSQDDLDWNKFSFSSFPFLNHLVLETPPVTCRKKTVRAPSGTGGFELSYFGVAEKNKKTEQKNSTDRVGYLNWSSACPESRATAEPKGNVLIPCHLREGNFEKSSLAELGCCTDIFAYYINSVCCKPWTNILYKVKNWKTSDVSTTDWMVEAQLCKLFTNIKQLCSLWLFLFR